MVEVLTADNFNVTIESAEVPVLIDCFATWCGPCKMMAPIVDEVSETFEGRLEVYKVDVDDNPQIARDYKIMSIPTFLIFRDGELVKRMVGGMDADEFEEAVEAELD